MNVLQITPIKSSHVTPGMTISSIDYCKFKDTHGGPLLPSPPSSALPSSTFPALFSLPLHHFPFH